MSGLLAGVNPRTLARAVVADQVRRVGQHQRLPPLAIAGLQVLWLLSCQVGQHASVGADEQAKVRHKATLAIAFADLVKPGEGADRFERGWPLRAEHIDTDRCRARILGPVQSLARRVERVLKPEIARTVDGSEAQHQPRRQLAGVRVRRFIELDPANDLAGHTKPQASRRGIWGSMFNADSALYHGIRAKRSRTEHIVQSTQRGTQTFHLGVAGSDVSSMSTRIVTTAFGGASHTPAPALSGVLVVNTLLSWIAAWTAAETQTLKNFGKEGQVLHPDVDGGTVSRPPSTRSQIAHGLMSGVDLMVGQRRAGRTSHAIRQRLFFAGAPAPQLARRLLGALDAMDKMPRGSDDKVPPT